MVPDVADRSETDDAVVAAWYEDATAFLAEMARAGSRGDSFAWYLDGFRALCSGAAHVLNAP